MSNETWFKTGGWRPIEEVVVVKTTEKTITTIHTRTDFNGKERTSESRHSKDAGRERYFPTWDEAKQYLVDKAEAELVVARSRLQTAQGQLGNMKGLTKATKEVA